MCEITNARFGEIFIDRNFPSCAINFNKNERIFIESFKMNGKVSPHNFVHLNGEQLREHSLVELELWQEMKLFDFGELGSKALVDSRSSVYHMKIWLEVEFNNFLFYKLKNSVISSEGLLKLQFFSDTAEIQIRLIKPAEVYP